MAPARHLLRDPLERFVGQNLELIAAALVLEADAVAGSATFDLRPPVMDRALLDSKGALDLPGGLIDHPVKRGPECFAEVSVSMASVVGDLELEH